MGNTPVPRASTAGSPSACTTRVYGCNAQDPPVPAGLFPRANANRARTTPRFRGSSRQAKIFLPPTTPSPRLIPAAPHPFLLIQTLLPADTVSQNPQRPVNLSIIPLKDLRRKSCFFKKSLLNSVTAPSPQHFPSPSIHPSGFRPSPTGFRYHRHP